MFSTFAIPTVRLTMSSRRRGEDMSLYDFAKKYQENQSSSDLVKKQNATEDKVLSARLEYLNNQKVLTMKTLEKEIDLIKRRKKYGWDGSRKHSVSSHHFDRASLPNTPRRWTKDNFSPAKFVKRKSPSQPLSKKHRDRTENLGERNNISSKEQKENEDISNGNSHVVNVTQAVNINSSSEAFALPTENEYPETQIMSDCEEKPRQTKALSSPERVFPTHVILGRDNIQDKTINKAFPSWSRHFHQKQNSSNKPQDSRRTPTPRFEERIEECINGSSMNLISRQTTSRLHHSDKIKPKINNNFNSFMDLGGGLKDLRFKNLESVLIPH